MILLSPFLTVLQIEAGSGAVIHTRLTETHPDAIDMVLDLPDTLGVPVSVAGLPGLVMEPGEQPGRVHLRRESRDLCVHLDQSRAFLRHHDAGRFDFLLLPPADLANLRHIAAHAWYDGGSAITLCAQAPYRLDAGVLIVDLCTHRPVPADAASQDRFVLTDGDRQVTVTQAGPARHDILLAYRPPHRALPVTDSETFSQQADCRLEVAADDEILTVPITVCDADRAWLYDKPYGGADQITGRHRFRPAAVRQSNPWVMMARWTEGVVFDEHGVSNEIGYLNGLSHGEGRHLPLPPGMRREQGLGGNGRLFLDRDALAHAPILAGPHIVFYGATLTNYTHWLIDAMLPLHILLAHAPPGARLLMPATLRHFGGSPVRICDHYAIMQAFGFGDLPITEVAEPYCRVEEAIWLEDGFIHNVPAACVRALRDRAMAGRPLPRQDRRLFIARRINRRVANADAMAPFLANQGFSTHIMEELSIDAQIELFASAEFIIAVHGAELGNLLFCQPGTKVLELAPDYDYKPYFSYMCNKLGLAHGVLPCATDNKRFTGNLQVDMRKFGALFRMLKNRL